MLKKHTAEAAVYIVRESMELMGGLGYIEDTVMPKLMRDVLVLPIWEGAGNIQVLDMLRAQKKSKGLELIGEEIKEASQKHGDYSEFLLQAYYSVSQQLHMATLYIQDVSEVIGIRAFKKLTHLYQIALMMNALDDESRGWIEPAIQWFRYPDSDYTISKEEVENLMAWEF